MERINIFKRPLFKTHGLSLSGVIVTSLCSLFRIRKYMNFTARDIVGMSAYEFYHLNDMMIVQDAHTDCELNYLFPD